MRPFAGRALAPANQSLRPNFDEQNSAVLCKAKTGLKRAHERHVHFAEDDAIDSHTVSFLQLLKPMMVRGDSNICRFRPACQFEDSVALRVSVKCDDCQTL